MKKSVDYSNLDFNFGDRRLVGQQRSRNHIQRILQSDRISHSYLFTGPPGIGKTAFSLAFAEAVNGIDHLTDLKGQAVSKKSSWFSHPDIHVFLPIPSSVTIDELKERLELLAEDPYEVVNFSLRPTLSDEVASKNRQAFYSIDYFRDEIKPAAYLKPNEGRRSVIIMTNVETMRAATANAFLKMLEEPSQNVMFILTTDNPDALLPTIISRCHIIRLNPLSSGEIEQGLIHNDGLDKDSARYLARVSGGNYAMTRFYDVGTLKARREEIVNYLRYAYGHDVRNILDTTQKWHGDLNIEGQIAVINVLEMFIRDIMVYRSTENADLVTNADQLDVIQKFCESLSDARLDDMIDQVNACRPLLYQNVQAKIIFTVLALRLSSLMRGYDPFIPENENWKHLPAFVQ